MSLFTTTTVTCPNCNAQLPMEAVGSVNADRRPDLRDDIISGNFQRQTCDNCGSLFRLEPRFTYLDIDRGLWIAVYPYGEIARWPDLCAKARDIFETAYGANAGPIAQEIGGALNWRVAFGWPAVREKIVAQDHGLDDGNLELTKLAIIRGGGGDALDHGVELRFVTMNGSEMVFCWIDAVTEEVKDLFALPRDLYDDIAANPAPWGALGGVVTELPFVDLQKTLYGDNAASAA